VQPGHRHALARLRFDWQISTDQGACSHSPHQAEVPIGGQKHSMLLLLCLLVADFFPPFFEHRIYNSFKLIQLWIGIDN
jgi:hypothetical protein